MKTDGAEAREHTVENQKAYLDTEPFMAVGHDEHGNPLLEKVMSRHLQEPAAFTGGDMQQTFSDLIYETYPPVSSPALLEAVVTSDTHPYVMYLQFGRKDVASYTLVSNQYGTVVNTREKFSVRNAVLSLRKGDTIHFSVQDRASDATNQILAIERQLEADRQIPHGSQMRAEKDAAIGLLDSCRRARSEYDAAHEGAAPRRRLGAAAVVRGVRIK